VIHSKLRNHAYLQNPESKLVFSANLCRIATSQLSRYYIKSHQL